MQEGRSLRFTRQRRVILDVLRHVDTHPSADEVYEMVRQRVPRISLGTVYRNLEQLAERGEIRKLAIGGTIKRFDGNPQPHYHLRCLRCQRVFDAPMAVIDDIEKPLEERTGFLIQGHHLEFFGLCPACRQHPPQAVAPVPVRRVTG